MSGLAGKIAAEVFTSIFYSFMLTLKLDGDA